MEYKVKIKNFGNDREFFGDDAVQQAKECLETNYLGKCVSLIYRSAITGMINPVFITVNEDGSIHHSYRDKQKVDFFFIEKKVYP